MLASILVGIDGSSDSDAAIELGIGWAKRAGASLIGVGVIDEPGIHGSEEVLFGEAYFRKLNAEILDEIRKQLRQAQEKAGKRAAEAGVRFQALDEVGIPSVEIVREAQRGDLVVLGQHTHFRFGWADAADVTLSRVLAHASRPVVAVPESLIDGDTVIVAYDGSLQSSRALAAFQALGLASERDIHIISADSDWQVAARAADRAVDYLWNHGIKSRAHPMPSRSAAETILDWVYRLRPGLVVMGAYGQPTLREFFLGSVTRTMLRESPAPVFLYH